MTDRTEVSASKVEDAKAVRPAWIKPEILTFDIDAVTQGAGSLSGDGVQNFS